jgi:hypothetical protein
MNNWLRGVPLTVVFLGGMLGAGLSLASVASTQDETPAAPDAADVADAGDSAATPTILLVDALGKLPVDDSVGAFRVN